jgi:hypothetical protein
MSRASLQRTGGFDPLFLMYGKDDLINRAAFHGIRTALVPAACVMHLPRTRPVAVAARLGRLPPGIGTGALQLRSSLLVALKDPAMSLPYGLAQLAVAGIVEPLLNLPLTREFRHAVLSCYATLRLAAELPRIARHPLIVRARMDRI